MFYRSDLLCLARGAELGGRGGICPPCFGDLFSKFWGIFENSFFAIYCRPSIKNLLPPTLCLAYQNLLHTGGPWATLSLGPKIFQKQPSSSYVSRIPLILTTINLRATLQDCIKSVKDQSVSFLKSSLVKFKKLCIRKWFAIPATSFNKKSII